MSDNELTGSPAPESGEIVEQQVVTEVQGTADVSAQAPDNQDDLPKDVQGLTSEVVSLRQKLRQKDEYAEFLKNAQQYQPAQQQQQEQFEFDPNGVPYNSDVQKIAEHVAKQVLNETLEQRESQNLEIELRTKADEIRKADSKFDDRMNLAVEMLQRDPLLEGFFMREKTAQGKIQVLEKIASFHPLYDTVKPLPKAPAVNEALERIKQNSQLPPVLTGVQSTGSTIKQVSQMTDDEYIEFFNKQKREL